MVPPLGPVRYSAAAAQTLADAGSLREALRAATSLVVLTGAGISAESGVPVFRGASGLWRNYSPESLATPEAFARDPGLVWEWYDWRRQVIHKAQPNAGHRALVELEQRIAAWPPGEGSFTLVTQNVDGLHDCAGSREVVKLHGDIWLARCTLCGALERNDDVPLKELPPRCRCGRVQRLGVVWFGEALPAAEWERASQASACAQVMMVIGTSAVVFPAAGLAELARAAGAKIAIVNPEPTPLDSEADWVLRGKGGEILPALL
jgi:NAD-dependent deacetylase